MAEADHHQLFSSDSHPLKRCKTLEDRISNMPDELISSILSRLTLKEAVATSTLSKRWKYLWVSYPNLDFGSSKTLFGMDEVTYLETISRILGHYKGTKLSKLRIVRPLGVPHTSRIDDWLSFALTSDVSSLELNLNLPRRRLYPKGYCISANMFRIQEHHVGAAVSPFVSLRDLCLRSVNFSDEVFDLILTRCCSLEHFLVMHCPGLVHPKNTFPHTRLRSLELYACRNFEKLELSTPNLETFKYHGYYFRSLCIKDSAKLVNLSLRAAIRRGISGEDFVCQFNSYIPKLESLVVDVHLFVEWSFLTQLPAFNNLKQLVMDIHLENKIPLTLEVLAFIMRSAPSLQILELRLPYKISGVSEYLLPMSVPQNLKELKILGFHVEHTVIRKFLNRMVKYAVSLEKIYIVTGVTIEGVGDSTAMTCFPEWDDRQSRKFEKYMSKLKGRLKPNTQLTYKIEKTFIPLV